MRLSTAAVLIAVAVGAATPARAQDDGDRKGIAGSLGVGYSSVGASCVPECAVDRQQGLSLLLHIAGHVSPQFTLGVETSVFKDASVQYLTPAKGTWTSAFLLLSAQWYPSVDSDFFIKIGGGIATSKLDLPFNVTGIQTLTMSDFGGSVGIGRDWLVGEHIGLTTFADALFTPRSRALINNADSGARVTVDHIRAGLAISIP
jgi:hypothetical protein